MGTKKNDDFFKNIKKIKEYYENYFDTSWLSNLDFENLEIGYLGFKNKGFAFSRNIYFPSLNKFKAWLPLINPKKLYYGSLHSPLNRKEIIGTELKFDIDVTDYDQIRKHLCGCQGKQMCNICFDLVKEAAYFIIETLDEDFANKEFPSKKENARIFFSGSKGLHIHYPNIYNINNDKIARKFIVEYLSRPNISNKDHIIKVIVKNFIMKTNIEILKKLTWLNDNDKRISKKKILAIFNAWKNEHPSFSLEEFSKINFKSRLFKYACAFRYPKIDGPITFDLNRLIKIPYSIDCSTMAIVHEIKLKNLMDFKLEDILTIDHFVH